MIDEPGLAAVATPPPSTSEPRATSAIRVLVLTDLVDSTSLFESLGDERGMEISIQHDRLVRERLAELGGQEIDKSDGFLLLFERPIDGVRFALDYHQALGELGDRLGLGLAARCGVHLGEVFLRLNSPEEVARGAKPVEVEGLAKSAVARLASLAAGGQTLLTRGVFDLARRAAVGGELGTRDVRWLAHGPYLFKGLDEAQEVFEVGVVDHAPLRAPHDTEKARRVIAPGDERTLGWRPARGQQIPRRPHWSLVEKVGEGGYGEVWLARHAKTGDQRVFKFCYDAARLRALEREVTLFRLLRETLGQRDDIARLLDWNFDEAPYSLEMEYTEGGSLVDWAAERGGLETVPLEVRLELLAQVADALAAAHSVGVLHKDVKPSNVLITHDRDGDPRAVLTDFGVGLITDRDLLAARGITALGLTGVTMAGEATSGGTQLYTAPELLAGHAPSIQADVYALGVMLYQLAISDFDRPLAPGWRRDVDDELLREDIATFVDGVPERRPASALEVADRLRRLEQRRKERAAERAAHQVAERAHRRRRVLAVVAAVSTVFLLVVSILAFQAIKARAEAERGRTQAEALIDFMLFELRDGLETIGRLDLLEQVARSSRSYFETFGQEDTDDSTYQRGVSLLNVGDVLLNQGDTEEALGAYRAAETIFAQARRRETADERWQEGWVRSQIALGDVLRRQGDDDGALDAFRAALVTAEELAERAPADRQRLFDRARAHHKMCTIFEIQGDDEAALPHCRDAVLLATELTADPRAHWRHWLLLIDAHIMTGLVLPVHRDLDSVMASYDAARRLAERRVEEDPGNAIWPQKLAWIHFRSGQAQYMHGTDPEAARDFLIAARDGYRELMTRDPSRVTWQAGFAQSQVNLGHIAANRGDVAAALELFRESMIVFHRLAERDPTRTVWPHWIAETHRLRGSAHARAGDETRARDDWREAARVLEPLIVRSDAAGLRETYAHVLLKLGRDDEAKPLIEGLRALGRDLDPDLLAALRERGFER